MDQMKRQRGGWQVISPSKGPLPSDGKWRWSASSDYGMRGESGWADTEDEARRLAQEAYERLNAGQDVRL